MAVNHAVNIHMPDIVTGENTLPCTIHEDENITLVYSGPAEDGGTGQFSLTDEEANDPNMGEVQFNYV